MESRSKGSGSPPFISDVFRRACAVAESIAVASSRLSAETGFGMLEVVFSLGYCVQPSIEALLYPLIGVQELRSLHDSHQTRSLKLHLPQ